MPHLCNARGLDGRTCFDCQPVDTAGPIVIHASVGRGGFNRSGDTRVIQAGLNDLDPSEGGPDPLLAEDSVVGPLTTAASMTSRCCISAARIRASILPALHSGN